MELNTSISLYHNLQVKRYKKTEILAEERKMAKLASVQVDLGELLDEERQSLSQELEEDHAPVHVGSEQDYDLCWIKFNDQQKSDSVDTTMVQEVDDELGESDEAEFQEFWDSFDEYVADSDKKKFHQRAQLEAESLDGVKRVADEENVRCRSPLEEKVVQTLLKNKPCFTQESEASIGEPPQGKQSRRKLMQRNCRRVFRRTISLS